MHSRIEKVTGDRSTVDSVASETRWETISSCFRNFLASLNVFGRYHPTVIGEILNLDTENRRVLVKNIESLWSIYIRYEKRFEEILRTNSSNPVEITGKIRIDREENPLSIVYIEKIVPVDTSDIPLSEVLPDHLKLKTNKDLLIKVELEEEKKRFYSGELEELNIFACGLSREHLKERLMERVDTCWDAFVTDDGSNFSLDALELRERLLTTFEEVKNLPNDKKHI